MHQSTDNHGMDQFIIFALLVGSILTTLAAARGMLGLLLHLMTLGRSSDRFALRHPINSRRPYARQMLLRTAARPHKHP
jgi:hypothetical protein